APRQMPPQQWGGSYGSMGPPGGGGGQGNFPTQQVFGGGYQGTPPWMGGGGGPMGANLRNFAADMGGAMGGAMGGGMQGLGPMQQALEQRFGANQADVRGQMQNYLGAMQGAMGGGAQGVGPNMILPAIQQMQGAMGGASPVGPQYQRRFPGALQRGILQGMAQPPPAPAAPAPYGGQQFRIW